MGRRALRKIDPAVDLSLHLARLDDLTPPWCDEALFPQPAPLEIEVGSGKGLFLVTAAMARPETNFLGVEVRRKYAEYTAGRLARRDQANARMIHDDALRLFAEMLPSDHLAAVHVYFPDPWWKARHRKRRVMNEAFLLDIQRTLLAGAALHFWTDVEEYFQTTLELIAGKTQLQGPLDVLEKTAEHDMDYRTNFERRKRMNGLEIYRAEFRKAT